MNDAKPIIKFEDFSKVDMRIGTVISAEEIPGSEKLLKMEEEFSKRLIGQQEAIVAVSKASAWLPGAGKQAFGVFRSIGAAAEDGSRAVLAPFVGVSQKLAELQGLFSALRSSWKKGIFR